MAGPGFVTSWLPQRNRRHQFPCRTAVAPLHHPTQMMLVSHEKLEVFSDSDDVEVAKYRFDLQIPASVSKDKRRECIAALKKSANYPGFRKGTIPPFVMKSLPTFVLQDSAEDMLREAMNELELRPLQEEEELDLDYNELRKNFTVGEDFTFSVKVSLRKFTGELNDSPGDDIIDVDSSANLAMADDQVVAQIPSEKEVELAASAQDNSDSESS
eukprot:GFKZ01001412.1.p1 GENE.GFKZ01001412.1~~GFKZ01001412.1.p1  ORF type:complete len:214 (-),score=44.70 GFKZ01001412.1:488-1129(-)